MTFARRKTRQIMVGDVLVGGDAPISVQSMTTTKTADVEGTLVQIYALAAAGADIVRCTCNDREAAEGLAHIVPRSPVPIIADIHNQYRRGLEGLFFGTAIGRGMVTGSSAQEGLASFARPSYQRKRALSRWRGPRPGRPTAR